MIVDTALEQALRTLKLSGMLAHPGSPSWRRLAPASSATSSSCRCSATTRSPAASPRRSTDGSGAPSSNNRPPWKGSTSPPNPKLPALQIRDLAALRVAGRREMVVLYAVTCLLGPRVLSLLFSRQVTVLAISGTPDGPSYADLVAVIDDVAHCPGLHPVGQSPPVAGLEELAETRARPPT